MASTPQFVRGMPTSDLQSRNEQDQAMKNFGINLFLCALSIASIAAQGTVDPTTSLIREEDFLRGIGDLGLARALDDLERAEPTSAATDPATSKLRTIARWRIILRSPETELPNRVAALEELRKARQELIESRPNDPRTILWLTDAAEDEFVLAFFGLDGGPEAIAGSPLKEVVPRAGASLDRIAQLLDRANAVEKAMPPAEIPAGSLMAQRIEEDAHGRRPMLVAAVKALRLAIDRSIHDPETQRSRPAEAAAAFKVISQLRSEIPPRLRAEADLAEVAAAAVAVQSDDARFGAARVMFTGDPMLTTLTRILTADCLVNERHGDEALKQLTALLATKDMPTALRLLTADAIVRTRVFMGKSPATEPSLDAWIMTLRSAQPAERAGVRRAVLERMAGALRGALIEGPLPPLASIAIARDRLLNNPLSSADLAALRQFAEQQNDREAQAAAIVVLAEIHSSQGDWPSAADDYRRFAESAPQEPMALASMQTALDIEFALDRANPNGREINLDRTLGLAVNRFAELPSRPNSLAQWYALKARTMIQDFLSRSAAPSNDEIAALTLAAAQIEEADQIARRAGFDPGPRVTATAYAARVAADFLSPTTARATHANEIPTTDQWSQWTMFDAQRILRLRLERAARHGTPPRAALERELASVPSTFLAETNPLAMTSLLQFLGRQLSIAAAMKSAGDPAAPIAAQRALDAAEAWESLHPPAELNPQSSEMAESFARFAADAAFLARNWEGAIGRSQAIASQSWATIDDIRRASEALSFGEIAANQAGNAALRDALRTRAMTSARELAARATQGSSDWWAAQVMQMRIAQAAGRGGESVQARIARLRALDPTLGGEPFHSALEKIAAIPVPSGSL